MQQAMYPDIIKLPTTTGDKMEYIEFDTECGGTIIIKLENITLVKKNARVYPKFETTYSVFVGTRSWHLSDQEGEVVYATYKAWLTRAIKS